MKNIIVLALMLLWFNGSTQDLIGNIEAYTEKARQDWQIPGMAVAIVKDQQVVLSKGFGLLEAGKPGRVDQNSLFAIASNTKAFISASLSLLVESGKLSWDDKVHQILPEFALYDPYVTAETTVADLLCHRVGLGTFSGDLMWYRSNLSAMDVVKKIKFIEPVFGFRDGYGYSNLMFITAGEVIRKVSGQSWDAFADSAFFNPLGMNRTVTSTHSLKEIDNVASPHKPFDEGNQAIDWVNWDNMGAAGGIISSVDDMVEWLKLQLNEGIVGTDTLIALSQQQKMWTIHNPQALRKNDRELIPGRTYKGYGLGWQISNYHKRTLVSHGGGYDGMYSKVTLVPEEELGIVVLTNSMKGISDPLCFYIIDRFLEVEERDWSKEILDYQGGGGSNRISKLKESRVKRTKPTHASDRYTGTYHSELHGKVKIKKSDDQLRLIFENAPGLNATLSHWHHDTWEISWDEEQAWFGFGLLQFLLAPDLSVRGLHFDVPNYDIFFDEMDLVRVE